FCTAEVAVRRSGRCVDAAAGTAEREPLVRHALSARRSAATTSAVARRKGRPHTARETAACGAVTPARLPWRAGSTRRSGPRRRARPRGLRAPAAAAGRGRRTPASADRAAWDRSARAWYCSSAAPSTRVAAAASLPVRVNSLAGFAAGSGASRTDANAFTSRASTAVSPTKQRRDSRALREPRSVLLVAVDDRVLAALQHDFEVAAVDRLVGPPAVDDAPLLAHDRDAGAVHEPRHTRSVRFDERRPGCVQSSRGTSSARASGIRDHGATSTTDETPPAPTAARTWRRPSFSRPRTT